MMSKSFSESQKKETRGFSARGVWIASLSGGRARGAGGGERAQGDTGQWRRLAGAGDGGPGPTGEASGGRGRFAKASPGEPRLDRVLTDVVRRGEPEASSVCRSHSRRRRNRRDVPMPSSQDSAADGSATAGCDALPGTHYQRPDCRSWRHIPGKGASSSNSRLEAFSFALADRGTAWTRWVVDLEDPRRSLVPCTLPALTSQLRASRALGLPATPFSEYCAY